MSCLSRCPYFRGVLNEGFHCSSFVLYKYNVTVHTVQCTMYVYLFVMDVIVTSCSLTSANLSNVVFSCDCIQCDRINCAAINRQLIHRILCSSLEYFRCVCVYVF